MTITEALAEIKTIGKRLETKRQFVLTYLCQHESLRDPLEKDGGSREALKRERQAIDDLERRIVDIRAAIARSNEGTSITIGGKTRTVTEWLAWRKDVALPSKGNNGTQAFLNAMRTRIAQIRQANQPGSVRQQIIANIHTSANAGGEQKPSNINVFVDEQELSKESEAFEETIGQLDGQLSLKNATTHIDLK
jgi:hypothetical protein